MSISKKAIPVTPKKANISPKKEIRKLVETKIEAALLEFKKDLSEKKFKKHIKKAGKILSDGLLAAEAAATKAKKAVTAKPVKAKKVAKPKAKARKVAAKKISTAVTA